MKRFENKGVVVTGAGRGIGRATAECFTEEGAGVVLFGWHADVLKDTAAGIREKGGRCEIVVGDVSSRIDIQRAVRTCSEAFGSHDYMVANAGIADFVPFLDGTDEFVGSADRDRPEGDLAGPPGGRPPDGQGGPWRRDGRGFLDERVPAGAGGHLL